ncbi:hypothetical protein IQ255_10425 [Pleurocapsales cyanobacterium LEGE 10410]|nr:hypothetical protein [Pleurocapsales cyanobacterium LEGE 10410]
MTQMQRAQAQGLDSLFFERSDVANVDNGKFAKAVVQISKLLVQRWLDEENNPGKEFDREANDVNAEYEARVREALKAQNIEIAEWITPVLDYDSSTCSLICDSEKPDFALIWKLPYRDFRLAIEEDILRGWITTCEEWLNDPNNYEGNDNINFPDTPHPNIPLATT